MRLREETSEKETLAAEAVAEVARRRVELASAEARAADREEAKKTLQIELLRIRQIHDQMRDDVAAIDKELAARAQRRGEAQRVWCMEYMEKATSKAPRMRRLAEDIVVAEADHLSSRACSAGA